jgi:uncharacterized membrane protein
MLLMWKTVNSDMPPRTTGFYQVHNYPFFPWLAAILIMSHADVYLQLQKKYHVSVFQKTPTF